MMKKIMKAILTMTIAVGVFVSAGSMQVKAATYSVEEIDNKIRAQEAKNNARMEFSEATAYLTGKVDVTDGNIVWYMYSEEYQLYDYLIWDGENSIWVNWTCNETQMIGLYDAAAYNYLLTITASENKENTVNVVSSSNHVHNFTWTTTQEAAADQDGMEEYRCSCGEVQARTPIPAATYIVKGLYGVVKDAPVNGTAMYDSGKLYCITDYIIRKMAERSDVTTIVTFEYQGAKYQMTIPAGADLTSVLADEDYFYGYFGFAAKVGATIAAL